MKKSLTAPVKDVYKVRNWQSYNKKLCERGIITLWIEDSVLRQWRDIDVKKKVVGEAMYPDSVIQCCLILGYKYGQKLRQTTGFVSDLLRLMGKAEYAVPDYTTLSRRQKSLPVELTERWKRGEKIDVGIDSTGLKVYGEGEWKVRKHGVSKRRTWRKLHIAIDIVTQEIISVELTGNDEDDAKVGNKMLQGKTDKLRSFRGDGAYDDFAFRKTLGKDVKQIIPPPIDAVVHPMGKGTPKNPPKLYLEQRNEAIEFIKASSRAEWKIQEGYHKRSRNEVVMFRFKSTFGGHMNTRNLESQKTEVLLKCKILNTHRQVGMPIASKVA